MIKNAPFFNKIDEEAGTRSYYSLTYDFSRSVFYVSLTKRAGEEIDETSIELVDFVEQHSEDEVSALHQLINTIMSI